MDAKEFFRGRSEINGILVLICGVLALGLVGYGFTELHALDSDPFVVMGIIFGIPMAVLLVGNMWGSEKRRKIQGIALADLAIAAAIIILAYGVWLSYNYQNSGSLTEKYTELSNNLGVLSFIIICIALLFPNSWRINMGIGAAAAKGKKEKKAGTVSSKAALLKGGSSIADAIALPFRSAKSLVIAIVLCITGFIVPFGIPLLPLSGYLVKAARKTYENGSFVLPDWNDWGDLFKKGIVAAIITLIFCIPLAAYTMNYISNMPFPEEDVGKPGAELGAAFVMIATDPIFDILLIATEFILPMALVFYAVRQTFGAAFSFGEISSRIFNAEYVKIWLATTVYLAVLLVIISAVFSPLIQGYIGGVEAAEEEEGMEAGWGELGTMIGIFSLYIIVQIFAIYLATMAQLNAFSLLYRKMEK